MAAGTRTTKPSPAPMRPNANLMGLAGSRRPSVSHSHANTGANTMMKSAFADWNQLHGNDSSRRSIVPSLRSREQVERRAGLFEDRPEEGRRQEEHADRRRGGRALQVSSRLVEIQPRKERDGADEQQVADGLRNLRGADVDDAQANQDAPREASGAEGQRRPRASRSGARPPRPQATPPAWRSTPPFRDCWPPITYWTTPSTMPMPAAPNPRCQLTRAARDIRRRAAPGTRRG